jgi:hypothetical protein
MTTPRAIALVLVSRFFKEVPPEKFESEPPRFGAVG